MKLHSIIQHKVWKYNLL